MTPQEEIRSLLEAFQDGYARRDLAQVDEFMRLFTVNAEVIGTNGIRPGMEEWYTSRETARDLVACDWEGWGDLRLDLDAASIRVNGNVGWVAAPATVTQVIGPENYAAYLEFITEFIQTSNLPAEEKLNYILRGGNNTVYELRRGNTFVWPLRFTAVAVREGEGEGEVWKFAQMNFSFPTVYFPDVRVFD